MVLRVRCCTGPAWLLPGSRTRLAAPPVRRLALRGEPPPRHLEDIGTSGGESGATPLRESLGRRLESIGKASEGSQASGSVPVNWKQVVPLMLVVSVATGFYYFSPQAQRFAHHRNVREEMLREARKEANEAGGREREKERQRAVSMASVTSDPEPSVSASRQMSREQVQQLLSAVQHRIANNRSLFQQTLPTDTTQQEILQKEHKALEARRQNLARQL